MIKLMNMLLKLITSGVKYVVEEKSHMNIFFYLFAGSLAEFPQ